MLRLLSDRIRKVAELIELEERKTVDDPEVSNVKKDPKLVEEDKDLEGEIPSDSEEDEDTDDEDKTHEIEDEDMLPSAPKIKPKRRVSPEQRVMAPGTEHGKQERKEYQSQYRADGNDLNSRYVKK